MSGRPDTSEMTEEDFKSMIDEDGNLRDSPQDQEEEVEPEEETEEEEEAEETEGEEEETEEEPEGDEAEELDWSAVDDRYKQEFEKYRSEADKWLKNHGKLQSQLTKESQSKKDFEQDRERLTQRDLQLSKIEELLEAHPHLVDLIDKEVAKAANPLESTEVPDYLKQDPAFQHMQKVYQPYIQKLEKQLQEVTKKTSRFDEMDRQQAEAKHKEALDTQLKSAGEKIKSMFGRDATEDEITEVLQYMVDNKFYGNAQVAALAVFGDRYEKSIAERQQAKMREKAGKFPARSKSVSPSRVKSNDDSMDLEDSIRMAMAEARESN